MCVVSAMLSLSFTMKSERKAICGLLSIPRYFGAVAVRWLCCAHRAACGVCLAAVAVLLTRVGAEVFTVDVRTPLAGAPLPLAGFFLSAGVSDDSTAGLGSGASCLSVLSFSASK